LILGLAIYNDVLLPVQFPLVVWRKLLGVTPTLQDLCEVDPDVGRNLQLLLEYDGGDEQEAFDLNFELTREVYGETRRIPLVNGGSSIPVTAANKQHFVDAYVRYVLLDSVANPFGAFARGFLRVAGGPFLQLLRAEDLQRIINGSGEESIDTTELERVTRYERGLSANHPLIVAFWQIVHSLSDDEKRHFMSFATGSDRIPIGGISSMQFVIRHAGGDTDRLPTASTCFNILHLPHYKTTAKLREKLLVAISNAEGFGLV
jgi:ubiquitin-protein ligase E3 A